MSRKKQNPYSGREYECACDYSYTCDTCSEVRQQWLNRKRDKDAMIWVIASIQSLAKSLGVVLAPAPVITEEEEP